MEEEGEKSEEREREMEAAIRRTVGDTAYGLDAV